MTHNIVNNSGVSKLSSDLLNSAGFSGDVCITLVLSLLKIMRMLNVWLCETTFEINGRQTGSSIIKQISSCFP